MPEHRGPLTIPVDVTNPGQFYACCGLLELATLVNPDATGCFSTDGFTIEPATNLNKQIAGLRIDVNMPRQMVLRLGRHRTAKERGKRITMLEKAAAKLLNKGKADPKTLEKAKQAVERAPKLRERVSVRVLEKDELDPLQEIERPAAVWLRHGERALRMAWWQHGPSGEVKTWAGGQVTVGAVQATHRSALPLLDAERPFDEAATVDAKPFYFDCRSGGDAVDQGMSFESLKFIPVLAYPAVEFLAFVGLNRFRPGGHHRRVKRYATWTRPLPATLAAAVAAGVLPDLAAETYRFRLHPRDASFRYKSFGRAEPVGNAEPQENQDE